MRPPPPRRETAWRSLVVLLAALAATTLTARLGLWQLDRAAQKTALAQAIEQRRALPELPPTALAKTPADALAQQHRLARLEGRWLADRTMFLDLRQMNGRVGFFVVTPLELAPGDAVLVQRGWVPRDAHDRRRVPAPPTPSGPVQVVGRIQPPPARLFDFGGAEETGPIRQNIDLDSEARALGISLRPFSVLQLAAPASGDDGLVRDWPHPDADVARHYGYAFQWFALAALVTGLYAWFQLIPRLRTR